MGPMPWEIAAQRRQQMGGPSQTPLTIDGPPRTPAPQTPAEATIQGNQAVASGLDPATKAATLEHLRLDNAAAAAKATEGKLTPSALDMAARQFIQSGTIPSFGMGGAAQKTAIINRAAEIAGVNGASPEQMQVGFARYRNGVAALQQQEKALGGLRDNEAGALANLQQYVDQSAQLPLQTGSPLVNSVTQFAQRHIWSDPTLARMDASMANAGGEMGKVISGTPQGGGVLSDSQRQEAIRILQGTAPIETKRAILEQLHIDMENRVHGYANVINQGYANLGGNNQGVSPLPNYAGAAGQSVNNGAPPTIGGAPSGPGGGTPGGGSPPPGGQGGPQTWRDMPQDQQTANLAKGGTHDVFDSATSAKAEAMLRSGATADQINRVIVPMGYPGVGQAEIDSAQAYLKTHPNYRGIFQLKRTVPLTGIKGALAPVVNSAGGAAVGSYLNDVTGSHLDNIANAAGGDGDLVNFGLNSLRAEHPVASLAGDVGAGASLYGLGRKIGGRLIGEAAARLPAWLAPAAGDAAMGGYMGSGANGTDLVSPGDMATGAALAAGGGAAMRGAANVAGGLASPTGGKFAPLYEQGVQPTLGQRVGGAVDKFEQANTAIPFAGALTRNARNAAVDQAQRGAFNTALKDIGTALPPGTVKGTQAHAFMQRAFDNAYDQARSGMQFVVDKPYLDDLAQFRTQLGDGTLTVEQAKQVGQRIQSAVGSRLRGGQLAGDSYSNATNDLTRTARLWAKNPATVAQADALHNYIDIMDEAATRASDPAAVAQLNAARSGYAKAVVIENASKMNTGGEFTGRQLDIAAKNSSPSVRSRTYLRGDAPMQQYAEGMSQLGDTVPDSGTPARLLATGGIGTIGAAHPVTMLPSMMSILANAPVLRQGMNALLSPNRASLAPVRAYINGRKNVAGSLFGASLAANQLSSGQ